MCARRLDSGASISFVMRIVFFAMSCKNAFWLAGSRGLIAMPSTPLATSSWRIRFWSFTPWVGLWISVCTLKSLPASLVPVEAMVQKPAWPVVTMENLGQSSETAKGSGPLRCFFKVAWNCSTLSRRMARAGIFMKPSLGMMWSFPCLSAWSTSIDL